MQVDALHRPLGPDAQQRGLRTLQWEQLLLDRAHVFVFLSLWQTEGHSNALNEAMGRGCVPVVTRQGFSADVVGGCGFVVADRDRLDAAVDWIAARWNAADWTAASNAAVDRIAENFTDLRVLETLRAIYSAALA